MSVYAHHTEEELLVALKKGDEQAFGVIYNTYWGPLYRTAYNRIRIKEVCQDIVQEVLMDIWKRRESLSIENLAAYLRSSVRFLTYKQLVKLPLDAPFYQEFEQTMYSYLRADQPLKEREQRQLLDCWINALPEKRRRIFQLHFFDELNTDEIAQKLGVSRKTVQNQLTTAYSEIRTKYTHFLSTAIILINFYKGL